MKCDDYIWYYIIKEPKLESYIVPNGRYFSNLITYLMIQIPVLKCVFYTFILPLMIIFTGKIIDFKYKNLKISIIFSFFMLLMIPSYTYSEVINWFSGFTNYIFSFLLTSVYILFCFKTAFGEYVPKKWLAPVMLVFAFLSGLCVEHISIYNILFSVFAIVLIKYKKKKIYSVNIFYTIGAVIGFGMMMSNNIYSEIMSNNDSIGTRKFEYSLSDIYTMLFRFVMINYSSTLWIVNVIIAVSLIILYAKSERNYKYGKLCFIICIGYAVYSVFSTCFRHIDSLHDSMKIKSVECAFLFIYLVSLLYLLVKILDKDKAIRCVMYLFSTLVVSFPFLIVSPFTARCMFVNYMFWILLSGELFMSAISSISFCKTDFFADIFLGMPLAVCVIIGGFNITNNYYNTLRYSYIKQQIEEDKDIIYIIEHPYSEYVYDPYFDIDTLFDKIFNGKNSYGEYVFRYYGIENGENYSYTEISSSDYNRLTES